MQKVDSCRITTAIADSPIIWNSQSIDVLQLHSST